MPSKKNVVRLLVDTIATQSAFGQINEETPQREKDRLAKKIKENEIAMRKELAWIGKKKV